MEVTVRRNSRLGEFQWITWCGAKSHPSGKPMLGFRTQVEAWRYADKLNNEAHNAKEARADDGR